MSTPKRTSQASLKALVSPLGGGLFAPTPLVYVYGSGRRQGISGLLELCREMPWLGIPLAIVVLAVVVLLVLRFVRDALTHHQDVVIRRFANVSDKADHQANLELVRRHDPKFGEALLVERVRRAFRAVQNVRREGDPSRLATFVSDGVYGLYAARIEEARLFDGGAPPNRLQVEDVALLDASSDGRFDALTFRISARAADAASGGGVDAASPQGKTAGTVREFWTFVRRVDAKTLRVDGLIEGRCPACGTERKTFDSDRCHACEAPLHNGDDWTLCSVAKACDWQRRGNVPVPGAADLVATDAEFSLASLEDRAAVVFWRLLAAQRDERGERLDKVASDEFCRDFAACLARDARGIRSYPTGCAIGSVDVCAIVLGREWDKAVVKIRWSGFLTEEDSQGRLRRTQTAQIKTEAFIFARRGGVKTPAGAAFAGAHCPACGRLFGDSPGVVCDACGVPQATGADDWLLLARKTMIDSEVQSLLNLASTAAGGSASPADPAAPTRPGSNLEQAAWMVNVMVSNGDIDPREKELLENFALRRGLTSEHIDQLTRSALAGALETRVPESVEETRLWLDAMAAVALANGVISKPERAALLALGAHLGYSGYDIDQIILRTRTRLYKARQRAAGPS